MGNCNDYSVNVHRCKHSECIYNQVADLGNSNRYLNGGPFTATLSGVDPGLVDTAFTTFRLERNEFFAWGYDYYYTINDFAYKGGIAGQDNDPDNNQDHISAKTADLYYKFRTISTFADDVIEKKALQAAFGILKRRKTRSGISQFRPVLPVQ